MSECGPRQDAVHKVEAQPPVQALGSETPKSRREAARTLGATGDKASLAPLCEAAVGDPSLLVRHEARQAVALLCARTGGNPTRLAVTGQLPLRPLIEGMESDHVETREWAMGLLQPALVANLVRQEARVADDLLKLVSGRSACTKVGWWAGLILAELNDQRAVIPLSHSLRIGSDKVRRWLLRVIGEMGYLRLVEFLCKTWDREGTSVRERRDAARALGVLGHPAGIAKLREKGAFWSFEDKTVKAACREAVKQIEERGVGALPISTAAPAPATDTLPRPAVEVKPDTETLPGSGS